MFQFQHSIEKFQQGSGEIQVGHVKSLPKLSDIPHILRAEDPSLFWPLRHSFGRPVLTNGFYAQEGEGQVERSFRPIVGIGMAGLLDLESLGLESRPTVS